MKIFQVQDWAKAKPTDENFEMDLEKPTSGHGANINVDTSLHQEEEESTLQEPAPQLQTANPFTQQQTSNPFRQ